MMFGIKEKAPKTYDGIIWVYRGVDLRLEKGQTELNSPGVSEKLTSVLNFKPERFLRIGQSPPTQDQVEFAKSQVEESIQERGIPKALVVTDITYGPMPIDYPGRTGEPWMKTKEEVLEAYKQVAEKHGIPFFYIPRGELKTA